MNYAMHLLSSTNKSIKEISFELNYKDQYHFSNVFKKCYGIAPLFYRKHKIGYTIDTRP